MRLTMTLFAILGGLIVTGVVVWIAVGMFSVAGVEEPKYEVVSKYDDFEVRAYAPRVAAEVTVDGAFHDALNRGFRKLAGYIFGANHATSGDKPEAIAMTAPVIERAVVSEKIAMTAPVIERSADKESRVVTFIMPSKYTLDTLPKPNDADVRLVAVPAAKYAVLRFSGSVSAEDADKRKQQIKDLVSKKALESVGEPLLAQYNPPWTPPFMRRNEVLLQLK